MSDKKQQQEQQQRSVAEERKNEIGDNKCVDNDRMVFPDEELKQEKPTGFATRNFANSNTNPGYGTDANGEIVEEFK